jgi:hypothetical protein
LNPAVLENAAAVNAAAESTTNVALSRFFFTVLFISLLVACDP